MTDITLVSFNASTRSVVFEAYGQQKTINKLGEFQSKESLIEYLQSVAETEMKPAATLSALPDIGEYVGRTLPEPSELE